MFPERYLVPIVSNHYFVHHHYNFYPILLTICFNKITTKANYLRDFTLSEEGHIAFYPNVVRINHIFPNLDPTSFTVNETKLIYPCMRACGPVLFLKYEYVEMPQANLTNEIGQEKNDYLYQSNMNPPNFHGNKSAHNILNIKFGMSPYERNGIGATDAIRLLCYEVIY